MDHHNYILAKVMQEHAEHDSEFYTTMLDFLDKRGWDSMLSLLTGSQIISYPSIKMPNGTLTQDFVSTANSNVVSSSPYLISNNSSTDYQISFNFGSGNANNSPQMYIGIFDSANNAASGGGFNFSGMNGYIFYITTGPSNLVQIQNIVVYKNGSTVGSTFIVTQTSQINLFEIRSQLKIFNSLQQYGTAFDMSQVYSFNLRYLHFYRSDGGTGNGNAFNVNIGPWPIL